MVNLRRNKLGLIAAGSVLVLALASTPAKAHDDYSIVGPAVAFITLGALLHHSHYSHHGHYGHHYRRHQPHYKRHRRHSYSHGGYRKPRHKHYDRY